jgi:cyclopropane fatty-acyl-phospholipid synthase-like methyltransferase
MACKNLGMSYIGIELSEAQTEYAKKRLEIVDFS